MRVLILYGTKHGQTEKVCRRVAASIERSGGSVELRNARRFGALDLRAYDTVILASGVWYGKLARSIERFATKHAALLAAKDGSLIAVSGAASTAAGMPTAIADADAFCKRTGLRPVHQLLVGGGEPYSKYSWWTRMIMMKIARDRGQKRDPSIDYEFTNWESVDRFADEVMHDLVQQNESTALRS
jgi:menaquinone-dependent protoporphyrinogen oxidase